jgi:hypothetical protein
MNPAWKFGRVDRQLSWHVGGTRLGAWSATSRPQLQLVLRKSLETIRSFGVAVARELLKVA